jgi:anti-sigma regulatory factor (Ser/Thr protein kinase)
MRVLTDAPDFSLSLTTASAYEGNVATLIAEQLNRRFGLQSYKSMNIHTCLQEALINAIVHGNLNIHAQFDSLEKFDEHYALIAERLADEDYRHRRVTISAWNSRRQLRLCISNEGSAFPLAHENAKDLSPHGRGLFLIQSLASKMWVGEDRFSLFMTFDY